MVRTPELTVLTVTYTPAAGHQAGNGPDSGTDRSDSDVCTSSAPSAALWRRYQSPGRDARPVSGHSDRPDSAPAQSNRFRRRPQVKTLHWDGPARDGKGRSGAVKRDRCCHTSVSTNQRRHTSPLTNEKPRRQPSLRRWLLRTAPGFGRLSCSCHIGHAAN